MKFQIAEIVMVESYSETLRKHPRNKTLAYKLNNPLAYNGFHNAKTRLSKNGFAFNFEIIKEEGMEYLKVKRTK